MRSLIVTEGPFYGETVVDSTAQVPTVQQEDQGVTDRLIVYFGKTNFKDYPVIMLALSSP
jgi:hypothetical protein